MSICKRIVPGMLMVSIALADQEERQDGSRWLLRRKRNAPQSAAQKQEQEELQKAALLARKHQQEAKDALKKVINPAEKPVEQLSQTAGKELSVKANSLQPQSQSGQVKQATNVKLETSVNEKEPRALSRGKALKNAARLNQNRIKEAKIPLQSKNAKRKKNQAKANKLKAQPVKVAEPAQIVKADPLQKARLARIRQQLKQRKPFEKAKESTIKTAEKDLTVETNELEAQSVKVKQAKDISADKLRRRLAENDATEASIQAQLLDEILEKLSEQTPAQIDDEAATGIEESISAFEQSSDAIQAEADEFDEALKMIEAKVDEEARQIQQLQQQQILSKEQNVYSEILAEVNKIKENAENISAQEKSDLARKYRKHAANHGRHGGHGLFGKHGSHERHGIFARHRKSQSKTFAKKFFH